jgi:hypothetical protein
VGFAAVIILLRTQRRCRQIMLSAWERVTLSRLKNKLKIMVSFYQVRRGELPSSDQRAHSSRHGTFSFSVAASLS